MTSDFNKRTKTCWFYFRVEGARKGVRYRFRILNFEKPDSLFKQGQRVLCYSCATEQWFRVGGHHLSYLPNNIHTLHAASFGPFTADAAADAAAVAAAAAAVADDVAGGSECPQLYTLDFTFEPSRDGDTLYFAPCFPYSVRDNVQHLSTLQVSPRFSLNVFHFCHSPASSPNFQAKEQVQMSSLCLSPCLFPCDLVTITGVPLPAPPCGRPSPSADSSPVDVKTFAVITARVHPGEPSASWMMRYSVFCAAHAA